MTTYSAAENMAVNYRAALQFLFAGKAIATVVNDDSGNRYTYRIRECDNNPNLHFVDVLTGSDNNSAYTFVGTVWAGRNFKPSPRSRISADAPSVKGFGWVLRKLNANALPPQVRVHHEGRCCRCGRRLTTPESVTTGIGPICAGR